MHPLGENVIKQVNSSDCFGRGLQGNHFTTDESDRVRETDKKIQTEKESEHFAASQHVYMFRLC